MIMLGPDVSFLQRYERMAKVSVLSATVWYESLRCQTAPLLKKARKCELGVPSKRKFPSPLCVRGAIATLGRNRQINNLTSRIPAHALANRIKV